MRPSEGNGSVAATHERLIALPMKVGIIVCEVIIGCRVLRQKFLVVASWAKPLVPANPGMDV